jgi:tetratricopeptide (TPR) repeat protein
VKGARLALALLALLAAVLATYSNHFDNGFQFDDYHTIVHNPAIRTLNVSRFFSDGSTLSVGPRYQAYRPLLVTSFALSYRLGGGLNPFWFHLSAFLWYLVLLGLLFSLCERIFEGARGPALLVTALFGLHPACAQTVNYIVQVADLYVALGIVAGVAMYARLPGFRRFGLYLIPPAAGFLAKPTGAIFAPILVVYLLLFDRGRKESLSHIALRAAPAFALCAGGLYFLSTMTPPTFTPADLYSGRGYLITQPYVALRYFRSFFLPFFLSGGSDLEPFDSVWRPGALAGFAFLATLAGVAVLAARRRQWRPVSFGLWWFLLGLVPTSVYPLFELENDHRMFLPFIGLSMAVVWTAVSLLQANGVAHFWRYGAMAASIPVLAALAWGAHSRNEIWRDNQTFWADVAAKNPNSGTGLISYGLALTNAGKPVLAWPVLQRAAVLAPREFMGPVGLALTAEALHHGDEEIQTYYKRAAAIAPGEASVYVYYARWLRARGRALQAQELFEHAAYLSPTDLDSRYVLLEIYTARRDWMHLSQTAYGLIDLLPGDAAARRSLKLASTRLKRVDDAERAVAGQPTADNYYALAAVYEDDGNYSEATQAAKRALELRPGFADAARILTQAESGRAAQ